MISGPARGGAEAWTLTEGRAAELQEPAHSVLSAGERERFRRLHTPGARNRYLGARLLSRSVLSARCGVEPAAFRFRSGRFGRPELEPNPWDLRFNITHTRGLIACVVTQGLDCGIDVERTPASHELTRYAPRRLAPVEREMLAHLPPSRRRRCLIDLWTLKEAYTKALGTGLQHGFHRFALHIDAGGPPRLNDPSVPGEQCARWQLSVQTIGGVFRLALAVRRPVGQEAGIPVPVRAFGE